MDYQSIKNVVRKATDYALFNNVEYTIIGFNPLGYLIVWDNNGKCKII